MAPQTRNDPAAVGMAVPLCRSAGLPPPIDAYRLAGGRNNRVWRVELADGAPPVVLKAYFRDPGDTRDRLRAEWTFLRHAWAAGARRLPRPLAADPPSGSALYSHLAGRRPLPGEVDAAAVAAAADFVSVINADGAPPLTDLPWASEACLSLDQHLATVDRRVTRLLGIADDRSLADLPLTDAAQALVADRLSPLWSRLRAGVIAAATADGLVLDSPLPDGRLCASPSDFGFHNALRDADDTYAFLDFEYAGRDDPAKLVCDFFCQPDLPVPADLEAMFLERIARLTRNDPTFTTRHRLLRDVYRVKWACIVLNEFLPVDARRRHFSHDRQVDVAQRQVQLDKAQAFLDKVPG